MSTETDVDELDRPFAGLTPERMLDAVETIGVRCDGRVLALNSYENRVYRVGVEDGAPLVAKFYRPERWSDATILEEHVFARELLEHEIPVAAPLTGSDGRSTLLEHEGFRFAVYPCYGGDWPELNDPESRRHIGRLLGRIHAVGALGVFEHRLSIDAETLGDAPRALLLERDFVVPEWRDEYERASGELLEAVHAAFERVGPCRRLRLHGDCHRSNVLWSPVDGPTFVDLDDCRMGPAVQDLWMMVSGDGEEAGVQMRDLLHGYRMFHDFDLHELALIEPLRALRMMHYAAWLAERWLDPAFPITFPWFGTASYWADHVASLRQQLVDVQAPPLELPFD